MTTINPDLARFAAELSDTYDALCDKYPQAFFDAFRPRIELRTVDGLTARFYEEGIEFYPKERVRTPAPVEEGANQTTKQENRR